MKQFVFFHVGEDISIPSKMVASLKSVMPDAHVTMCTDDSTPKVPGVDERKITKGNKNQLMYWRARAFFAAKMTVPAMYIDTDMIFKLPVDPEMILGDREIMLCRRSFDRDAEFNGNQFEGAFKKYQGIPMGTLYPYVGCAVIAKDWHQWKCISILMGLLDANLMSWYGDQEALKIYSHMLLEESLGEINENEFACLPGREMAGVTPRIFHYKGPLRKEAFLNA